MSSNNFLPYKVIIGGIWQVLLRMTYSMEFVMHLRLLSPLASLSQYNLWIPDSRILYIFECAINDEIFNHVSSCETAKDL